MKELQYPGLRLLVSGAIIDREWFDKDFSTLLKQVENYGAVNNINLELDDAQKEAARAAHSARDIQEVFRLVYWPTYDELRIEGTIPPATDGYWTP